jgi:predicted house-cleaning noncanonical NTP pyrophosphatase (MazG superfamily)
MAKRIVDKLVRDHIVKHMEEQWKKVTYRNLEHLHEKKEKLVEKLGEKYKELFESLIHQHPAHERLTDSMADMLEVMNKIAQTRWIDLSTVMVRKKQKIEEKGGYENFVFIQHVEE